MHVFLIRISNNILIGWGRGTLEVTPAHIGWRVYTLCEAHGRCRLLGREKLGLCHRYHGDRIWCTCSAVQGYIANCDSNVNCYNYIQVANKIRASCRHPQKVLDADDPTRPECGFNMTR